MEKCKSCGNKIKENQEGVLCPTCGDYFCFDCLKEANREEDKSLCPVCKKVLEDLINFTDEEF